MRYILLIVFLLFSKLSFSDLNLGKKITIEHYKSSKQIKNDSLSKASELISMGGGMLNDLYKNNIIYSLIYYADTLNKILFVYLMKTDTASKKISNSWISTNYLIVKGLSIKDIYASAGYICRKINDQSIFGIVYYDIDSLLNVYKLFYVDEKKERIRSYRKTKPDCGFFYIY